MRKITSYLLGLAISSVTLALDPQLVVHEWGTFTTLQDPAGRELGAINEDVEALPEFVKNLIPSERGIKGFPVHPAVTMRLETPVVYFHLPKDAAPLQVDYTASFAGGLLTQYYPDAQNNYSQQQYEDFGKKNVTGTLTWKNITVGKSQAGPETKSHVWLAPRKVDAADITNDKGESERYLFYRGVGNLKSPIAVNIDSKTNLLAIMPNELGASYATGGELTPDKFWYMEINESGLIQYVTMDANRPMMQDKSKLPPLAITGCPVKMFYLINNKGSVREEIKQELIKQGLFEDEAAAMLNTWEESYFKSPGTRVLYVVPKKWVDHYLPIKVSVPAKIERVMIGRIDLVTPEQQTAARDYLKKNKPQIDPAMPAPAAQSMMQSMTAMPKEPLPQLGRFTNAILWDTYLQMQLDSKTTTP